MKPLLFELGLPCSVICVLQQPCSHITHLGGGSDAGQHWISACMRHHQFAHLHTPHHATCGLVCPCLRNTATTPHGTTAVTPRRVSVVGESAPGSGMQLVRAWRRRIGLGVFSCLLISPISALLSVFQPLRFYFLAGLLTGWCPTVRHRHVIQCSEP